MGAYNYGQVELKKKINPDVFDIAVEQAFAEVQKHYYTNWRSHIYLNGWNSGRIIAESGIINSFSATYVYGMDLRIPTEEELNKLSHEVSEPENLSGHYYQQEKRKCQ